MAITRTTLVRYQAAHKRVMPVDRLQALSKATEIVSGRLLRVVATRPIHARLALLGIPLVIAAALTGGQWWAIVPLTACAWWWAPSSWGWEWLEALGRGLVGAEWALVGCGALAAFPGQSLTVAVVWAGAPALLAARFVWMHSKRQQVEDLRTP